MCAGICDLGICTFFGGTMAMASFGGMEMCCGLTSALLSLLLMDLRN